MGFIAVILNSSSLARYMSIQRWGKACSRLRAGCNRLCRSEQSEHRQQYLPYQGQQELQPPRRKRERQGSDPTSIKPSRKAFPHIRTKFDHRCEERFSAIESFESCPRSWTPIFEKATRRTPPHMCDHQLLPPCLCERQELEDALLWNSHVSPASWRQGRG